MYMLFFLCKITHRHIKKITWESEAVPPVHQHFVNFQTKWWWFFTGEIYMIFFHSKLHTDT